MPIINQTRRQFKSRMATKQDVWRAIPALLGDGNGTVEVAGQPGYVYIRVGDGDLGQAFNNRCQLRDNLAVYVGYDPITDPDRRIFQVLTVRMADYAEAGYTPVPNVGPHNTTHYFGGGDDVYVEWRRLMGLRVGRPVAFVVTVDPGIFYSAGAWTEIPSTTVDLTATHAALVGVQAQYVLISLSPAGVVTATVGAAVASIVLLTMADCPSPPAGHIPLAAVRLYKVQTSIDDVPASPDIVDLRFPTYGVMASAATLLYPTTRVTASPYAVLSTDEIIYVDTDGGAITVNLPAGVDGKHYKVINCGSSGNDITLDPNGAEQIYGSGAGVALTLFDGEVVDLHFETTENWW